MAAKKIGYARNDTPVTFGKADKRVIDCYQIDGDSVFKEESISVYSM